MIHLVFIILYILIEMINHYIVKNMMIKASVNLKI